MMRKLTGALILFMSVECANAQPGSFWMMGAGAESCAEFAQKYALSPDLMEPTFFSWAQGFMSGLNLLRSSDAVANLAAKSTDQEKLEIRQYCDQHPLASYYEAVSVLFKSLPLVPLNKH